MRIAVQEATSSPQSLSQLCTMHFVLFDSVVSGVTSMSAICWGHGYANKYFTCEKFGTRTDLRMRCPPRGIQVCMVCYSTYLSRY
jgi:hypothetical protein